MKKVSIIVPVYNSESTLVSCLTQLVNQTLQQIEIIIVNDASTDASLSIINDFVMKYPEKVRVINSMINRGPGGARNLGIEAATGEYIGFVDSDDIVHSSMYQKLYEQAEVGKYDIVDTGFYNQKENQAFIYTSDDLTGELNASKRSSLIVAGGYIWCKIFNAKMIKENPYYQFRENVILEDSDYLTYAFATAHSIGNVKEVLYQYSYSSNTVSESNTQDPVKYYQNIVEAIEAIYTKLSSVPNYHDIQKAVEYEMVQMYLYGIIICLKYVDDPIFQSAIKIDHLMKIKKKSVFYDYVENPYIVAKITGDDFAILQQF